MPSTIIQRLKSEVRAPLSHGSPVEGSVLRFAVLCVIALYAFVILHFAEFPDPAQRAATERVLYSYLPLMVLIAGAYFAYMVWNPADHSTSRVFGTALFDSGAAALCITGGPLFQPFLVLFPWFSLVYGVRFGPAWLALSTALSTAHLFYLFGIAPEINLDRLVLGSSIVSLLIVAGYCHRLISRLTRTQNELARLATCDPLTGLPNRRLLHDRLAQALALGPRIRRDLAVLYFDLDGFKCVNDTLGHAVGDQLLQEVAQRVQRQLRTTDTLSRIAGDEFVVVLEGLRHNNGADRIANAILDTVRNITVINGAPISISASIGVALWPTASGALIDPDELIEAADQAMYQAKNGGKNQIRLHSSATDELTERPVTSPIIRTV